MVRKVVTALLVLGLVLIGLQPVSAPAASAQAVAMEMQQPCCPDCDQPVIPADRGCAKMIGCMTSTPLSALPAMSLVPVTYATRLLFLPSDQSSGRAADVSPPFRPPRSPILT